LDAVLQVDCASIIEALTPIVVPQDGGGDEASRATASAEGQRRILNRLRAVGSELRLLYLAATGVDPLAQPQM
jgi:hypothetical protein